MHVSERSPAGVRRRFALLAGMLLFTAAQAAAQLPVSRIVLPAADPIRFSRVTLTTGVTLQVAEAGPADGEPVLFLHGYTDSWFSFEPVLKRLPKGMRAIVPSQRGHGESERPACCYRAHDFADDAIALLDALKLDRVNVVGHSMGSFVAQRIAIDHPERVKRLVLTGSGVTAGVDPVRELNAAVAQLTDSVPADFVRDFQASTAFEPLPATFFEGVVAESSKLPARLWREVLASIIASDAKDELHRIQAPTLIIWGEEEQLWPRSQQEALARVIPGARIIGYPRTGHAPNWEQPDRFVSDLTAFLSAR